MAAVFMFGLSFINEYGLQSSYFPWAHCYCRVSGKCKPQNQCIQVVLLDLQVSGCLFNGADKCLQHLFAELKDYAKDNRLYLHMNGLTRTILRWPSQADFPCGFLGYRAYGFIRPQPYNKSFPAIYICPRSTICTFYPQL